MKRLLFAEVVLIGLLGNLGWSLFARLPPSLERVEREHRRANQRLRYRGARGIGASGDLIEATHAPGGGQHTLVFYLRARTASDDLAFWREVKALMPASADARLVAYCDPTVSATLFTAGTSIGFPVIEYAEVADFQALLNADSDGDFLTLDESPEPRRIPWRIAGQTPAEVVRRVLR